MRKIHCFRIGVLAALIGSAFVAGTAYSQQVAPRERKGVTIATPAVLDLGTIVDSIPGRQLVLRQFTVEPAGVLPMHNHANSPGVARVLQGTMTIHAENGTITEYKAGENFSVGKDDTHWEENRGTTPLIFVFASVQKPPAQ